MLPNTSYIILVLFAILPLLYKFLFWFYVTQLKEYRYDRFFDYIKSPQGLKALLSSWFFIELALLIFTLYYLWKPNSEVILYTSFMIVLTGENIFVLAKLYLNRVKKPTFTFRWAFTYIVLILVLGVFYYFVRNAYIGIIISSIFAIVFILVSILISYPLVYILKKNKYKEARKIMEKYDKITKIGITGSYGKTSQKEFLSQILGTRYKILTTPKNINTELGVSDVIIKKLNDKYDFFIAEMGAYKKGEISTLGKIIEHKYGFITAIGTQHLGLFGSLENIKKAKSEIGYEVIANGGILYVNYDNKIIRQLKFYKGLELVKYGTHAEADARSEILEIENGITKFKFKYNNIKATFKTNLIGKHNIINITGSIALALDLGFMVNELKETLLNMKLPENTLDIIETKNNIIINDTYNLSEGSLFSGLEILNSYKTKHEKVLIMDDILELGKESPNIHYKLGKKIAKKGLATSIVYAGVNYQKDFINGLLDGGYKICNIYCDSNFIKKGDIVLFEGRGTGKLLNKLIGEKQ